MPSGLLAPLFTLVFFAPRKRSINEQARLCFSLTVGRLSQQELSALPKLIRSFLWSPLSRNYSFGLQKSEKWKFWKKSSGFACAAWAMGHCHRTVQVCFENRTVMKRHRSCSQQEKKAHSFTNPDIPVGLFSQHCHLNVFSIYDIETEIHVTLNGIYEPTCHSV